MIHQVMNNTGINDPAKLASSVAEWLKVDFARKEKEKRVTKPRNSPLYSSQQSPKGSNPFKSKTGSSKSIIEEVDSILKSQNREESIEKRVA